MSNEALKTILDTEKEADALLASAVIEAKKILSEAVAEGQQLISTATLEATEMAQGLKAEAVLKASVIKSDIAELTTATSNTLRQTAAQKIQQAVQLVVESIVTR